MARIRADMTNGRNATLAVCDLDRGGETMWGATLVYDAAMSLRTKGPDQFILSVHDMHLPIDQREVHGWLPDSLRFTLMGHNPEYCKDFTSQRGHRAATGNAHSVYAVAAVTLPLVEQAILTGVMHVTKRQPALTNEQLCELSSVKRRRTLASQIS